MDMDMDGKFHIYGKPDAHPSTLNLVKFGLQMAKKGPEFRSTKRAAITLGFATHSRTLVLAGF